MDSIRKPLLSCALVSVILVHISCSSAPPMLHSVTLPAYWPTAGWRTASPESQGLSSRDLAGFLRFIQHRNLPVHSILIVRNGYAIVDASFYPYDGATVHDVASVTKSVLSLLVGIAVHQGFIRSLDEPISSCLPQYASLLAEGRKDAITIRNLITMTSGLQEAPTGSPQVFDELLTETMRENDWGRFILSVPLARPPGTHFSYNSAHYHLLSLVLTAATGVDPLEFARKNLFAPLGITDLRWPRDPQGNLHGWGDLKLRPEDMAKIGFLCLNDGVWDGRRILTEGWVDSSFTPDRDTNREYGYAWWIPAGTGRGTIQANGRGGQQILIWPRQDIVAVFTGGGFDTREVDRALTKIPIHRDPLPEDAAGTGLLEAAIHSATADRSVRKLVTLPKTAYDVSDRTWRFGPNQFGMESLCLSFSSDQEAYVRIGLGETTRLRIGLDGRYVINPSGREDLPVAVRGTWADGSTFVLEINEIGDINDITLRISFSGNRPRFTISDRTLTGGREVELLPP